MFYMKQYVFLFRSHYRQKLCSNLIKKARYTHACFERAASLRRRVNRVNSALYINRWQPRNHITVSQYVVIYNVVIYGLMH